LKGQPCEAYRLNLKIHDQILNSKTNSYDHSCSHLIRELITPSDLTSTKPGNSHKLYKNTDSFTYTLLLKTNSISPSISGHIVFHSIDPKPLLCKKTLLNKIVLKKSKKVILNHKNKEAAFKI
jgi:hypothetical protein